MSWIIAYLFVGVIVFASLCKALKIDWDAESIGMKLSIIAVIPLWPVAIVIIFIQYRNSRKY